MTAQTESTPPEIAHLNPVCGERAHRHVTAKAIAEFTHERLLVPQHRGGDAYVLHGDDERMTYRFHARRFALDHWHVDPGSIERYVDGSPEPIDAQAFIVDFQRSLQIPPERLGVYLEEIASTVFGSAYKRRPDALSAKELASADLQTVEAAMSEGHPCFVANNGRIGYDLADFHAYAPESGSAYRLVWLAVRADRTTTASTQGADYDGHIRSELGPATHQRFLQRLTELGLEPQDYRLLPTHPWQWQNKVAMAFAGDIARHDIVYLGFSDDRYRAQQSVRTGFNIDRPERCYVKTSLSVLNMGFMRGLSPGYMAATPAINDWLRGLVTGDSTLLGMGFGVLSEIAAAGYHQPHYDRLPAGSAYQKMLSALWRESPIPTLEPGQRAATMAALLHIDPAGDSYATSLIESSGLAARDWLRRYLDAYLAPLLHCFYRYGVVFMPHGENLIMILDNGVPTRVLMKDIGEEVVAMRPEAEVPPEASRVRIDVGHEYQLLSLFTDVFDCFFRFLAPILDERGVLAERDFWRTVRDCVRDYQHAHPELAERFAAHDIFASDFALSCLNRLQLRNNEQMVELSEPSEALQLVGTLRNPVAAEWLDAKSA